MRKERIRIRLCLSRDADMDAVLAAAREALGREPEPATRLPAARLLSLWAGREELEALGSLPGVLRAEPEGRCELPPPPVQRRESK